jgi:hypothetical protein
MIILTTIGCCGIHIQLVGMLGLEPSRVVLGCSKILTKVGTILPTAIKCTLASALHTIYDNDVIKKYKLLELGILECMAIT